MVGNITIPSTRYPPYGIELSSLQRNTKLLLQIGKVIS